MAAKGWFSRQLKKMRDAGMPEEHVSAMENEGRSSLPPDAWEGEPAGADGDQHVHIHLERPTDDEVNDLTDPNPDGAAAVVSVADFQALAAKVADLEKMLLGDEEEVELEDQDTQDKRRFKLRRRDAIKKTHDDSDVPTPERAPEMMGETDLPGTEDLNKRTTADSVAMEPLWQATIAAAEIIVPGYRIPTFDAQHRAGLTAKRLCALRRGVMTDALKDTATAAVIRRFTGDAAMGKMPCDAVKIAFTATADALKVERNGGIRPAIETRDNGSPAPKVPSLAEMNKKAGEFWNGQGNGSVRH